MALTISLQSLLAMQVLFVLRQDVIAERFCVNRDQPEMHCDGKCFLAKRIHDTHDHGQQEAKAQVWLRINATSLCPAYTAVPARAADPYTYFRASVLRPDDPAYPPPYPPPWVA